MKHVTPFLFFAIAAAFRCVNFYGLETPETKLVCSWKHPASWYLDQLQQSIGIDSVRIPFSYEYVSRSPKMEGLHELVDICSSRKLSVILDYHRGYADHQGPSPIEKDITFEMYSELWLFVLDQFAGNPTVTALSLFNEYQGQNKTEAELLQMRMARIIESVFPSRFIYMFGCAVWGTDCAGMYSNLKQEPFWDRSFIEIHTYSFQGPVDPNKFPSEGKIFVGELGWYDDATDWAHSMISFLKAKGIKDVCFWTIAHSHDTANLYEDDCETPKNTTMSIFNSLYALPRCLRGSHS